MVGILTTTPEGIHLLKKFRIFTSYYYLSELKSRDDIIKSIITRQVRLGLISTHLLSTSIDKVPFLFSISFISLAWITASEDTLASFCRKLWVVPQKRSASSPPNICANFLGPRLLSFLTGGSGFFTHRATIRSLMCAKRPSLSWKRLAQRRRTCPLW
jgi:hypothetical protein